MQKITNCCGYCDLKTGTLIVGISGILFTLSGIITHTVALDNIEDESLKEHVKIVILYSYVYIFVDVMLIYGSLKESKYFLLPWIACVGFSLVLFSVFCVIFMFFISGVVVGTFLAAGFWYVWYCVLSYYNELNAPTSTIVSVGGYPEVVTQSSSFMAPSVVAYETKPPSYAEVGKGPDVV